MKENSIEETKKQLELILKVRKEQKEIIECLGGSCMNCNQDIKALTESIEILSDYKRVLKENEELKRLHIQDNKHLDFIMQYSITVQKVKDKIEKLNDESHAEELEDIMNRKNYTITELVQYVLQELIEGRK